MKILDMKTIMGFVGATMAGILPALELLTGFFQVVAGAGGLVLLALSIRHKILQIKNDNKNH